VYRVGDAVPGGAKLHAIFGDRVLLDRGGNIEALSLPRQFKPAGVAVPPAPARVATAPQGAVERVQQMIRDNPGVIGDIMRPQAVIVQGQQRGIRVFPGPNREAFNKLGLRPGDMVTAINGTPLDDPSRSTEIFGTLSSAAAARVSVMRNGRQEEITLNIAQVAEEADRLRAESQAGNVPPPPASEPANAPSEH
jgi:general secretion pathway protein C